MDPRRSRPKSLFFETSPTESRHGRSSEAVLSSPKGKTELYRKASMVERPHLQSKEASIYREMTYTGRRKDFEAFEYLFKMQELQVWMSNVLGESPPSVSEEDELEQFTAFIRDGTKLCQVVNKIRPNSIQRINSIGKETSANKVYSFKAMENILFFLQTCQKWGVVTKGDIFAPPDLFYSKNVRKVVDTLVSFAHFAIEKFGCQFKLSAPSSGRSNSPRYSFSPSQMNTVATRLQEDLDDEEYDKTELEQQRKFSAEQSKSPAKPVSTKSEPILLSQKPAATKLSMSQNPALQSTNIQPLSQPIKSASQLSTNSESQLSTKSESQLSTNSESQLSTNSESQLSTNSDSQLSTNSDSQISTNSDSRIKAPNTDSESISSIVFPDETDMLLNALNRAESPDRPQSPDKGLSQLNSLIGGVDDDELENLVKVQKQKHRTSLSSDFFSSLATREKKPQKGATTNWAAPTKKTKKKRKWNADEILPNLYLGDQVAAANRKELRSRGITHVINLLGGEGLFPKDFTYTNIFLYDSPFQDIIQVFPQSSQAIAKALETGGGVIVHCQKGVSRSATILIAYLMQKYNYDCDKAGDMVIEKRPVVCPNLGFIKQLKLYEKMKFQLQGDSPSHKKYHNVRLLSLLSDEQSRYKENTLKFPYAGESFQCSWPEAKHFFKCAKCKKDLFPITSQLPHEPEEDELDIVTEPENCKFISTIPFNWMEKDIATNKRGQIHCPGCSEVIGEFNWDGAKCPCKFPQNPASFFIQKDHVTKDQ